MSNDLQAIFGDGFDSHSVEPQKEFVVVPPGQYPVIIEKAEVKVTKRGDGHYIKLEMCILDGAYKNRKLWDQINIDNPSTQCVEIGLSVLAALGQALDIAKITDTAQLVNGVVVAHAQVKGDYNSVRTYSSVADSQQGGQVQQQQLSQLQPQTPVPSAQQSAPPWAR